MNSKPLFVMAFSPVIAYLLVYVNQSYDLFSITLFFTISLMFCSLCALCHEYILSFYSKKGRESSLVESLLQLLYYSSKGNTSQRSLSYIIEASTVSDIKRGFERIRRQIRLGKPLGEAIGGLFTGHLSEMGIDFSDEKSLYNSLRKFLSSYSANKSSRSSLALDSLQRNSTVNMFISTLLPSFLLFIFVGTAVISPSQTGLLFISIMILIVVPLVYALSSMMFSRRLIVETL